MGSKSIGANSLLSDHETVSSPSDTDEDEQQDSMERTRAANLETGILKQHRKSAIVHLGIVL
jgi:hypothetical protein